MASSWMRPIAERLGFSFRKQPRLASQVRRRLEFEVLEDAQPLRRSSTSRQASRRSLTRTLPARFPSVPFSAGPWTRPSLRPSHFRPRIRVPCLPTSGSFTTTTTTNDTFVANYSVSNPGNTDPSIPNIAVRVSGAENAALGVVNAQTVNSVFSIDLATPVVQSVTVSNVLITAANTGGTFTVRVTYTQAMNASIAPTITFTPTVSTTLTFTSVPGLRGIRSIQRIISFRTALPLCQASASASTTREIPAGQRKTASRKAPPSASTARGALRMLTSRRARASVSVGTSMATA